MSTPISSQIQARGTEAFNATFDLGYSRKNKVRKDRINSETLLPVGTKVIVFRRVWGRLHTTAIQYAEVIELTASGQVKLDNGKKFYRVRTFVNNGRTEVSACQWGHTDTSRPYHLRVISYPEQVEEQVGEQVGEREVLNEDTFAVDVIERAPSYLKNVDRLRRSIDENNVPSLDFYDEAGDHHRVVLCAARTARDTFAVFTSTYHIYRDAQGDKCEVYCGRVQYATINNALEDINGAARV